MHRKSPGGWEGHHPIICDAKAAPQGSGLESILEKVSGCAHMLWRVPGLAGVGKEVR